jgi:hypothetical protein
MPNGRLHGGLFICRSFSQGTAKISAASDRFAAVPCDMNATKIEAVSKELDANVILFSREMIVVGLTLT